MNAIDMTQRKPPNHSAVRSLEGEVERRGMAGRASISPPPIGWSRIMAGTT